MATRAHIDRHYDEELQELRHLVLEMGGFVEKQIADAMRALVERDEEFARLIIERDKTVNRMDVQIDDSACACWRCISRRRATCG